MPLDPDRPQFNLIDYNEDSTQSRDSEMPLQGEGKQEIIQNQAFDLQFNLYYEMLPEILKGLNKKDISMIDWGCGVGSITRACENTVRTEENLKEYNFSVLGYEPNTNIKKRRQAKNIEFTAKKPEKQADILLCHFSLHHMDEKTRESLLHDIQNTILPEYWIIGEFDFKGQNIDRTEFIRDFNEIQSGQEELDWYKKQYGEEDGLEKCYQDHMRMGLQECLDMLEKIGYEIKRVDRQKQRFLIEAKRQ